PTSAEINEIRSNAPNWMSLVGRILMHPRFLTHFERDGQITKSGAFALTDYELEARLTAIFWKSVPDVAGIDAARSGSLRTPAGLKTEVVRILTHKKAKETLWTFYQQWLALSRLPAGNSYSSGPAFDAFASPYTAAQLDQNFKEAVVEDTRQFLEYITFTQNGSLETIFRSPLIFTTNSLVAGIYGVSPRADAAAAPITDTSGHFKGILTRPSITQQKPSVNGETNHILRGTFLLENILGFELGQPANFNEQQGAGIIVPPTASTRTQVNLKTGAGTCAACHSQINPSGFSLGNFDSLGRYQTTERRFRITNGMVDNYATNPVDATTSLRLNSKIYTINDADGLVDALFQSERIYEGFTAYYFQFSFGRAPLSGLDNALYSNLKTALKTKSVRESLELMALLPEFSQVQPAGK
ncbi:MAG: DUF1592 domain-containing protein, partial [Proteobacteria bacterium]